MSSNPHKPVELEPIDMHAPVEVTIKVRMTLSDGTGHLDMICPPGVLPTRAEQLAIIDAVMDEQKLAASGLPIGTRPMNKPEFVAFTTKRETGIAMPLPGDQHYVPASCEIPHGMLIHAIVGAGFPTMALAQEYETRGLVTYTGNQHNQSWDWNTDLLDALPDAMLLEIYRRLTA